VKVAKKGGTTAKTGKGKTTPKKKKKKTVTKSSTKSYLTTFFDGKSIPLLVFIPKKVNQLCIN